MNWHLDFGGLDKLDHWTQADVFLICLMTVGQMLFVIMWLFLPWWKEWIGRALMIKSASLALLLILTITNAMLTLRGVSYTGMNQVQLFGYLLVTVGIWSQVIALGYEIRAGNIQDIVESIKTQTKAKQVERFRPLFWIGTTSTFVGALWLLTTEWDVLALIVVCVGISLVVSYRALTRPVDINADLGSDTKTL